MIDNSPIYILKAFESGCIGLHLQQFKNHSQRIKKNNLELRQSRIKHILEEKIFSITVSFLLKKNVHR